MRQADSAELSPHDRLELLAEILATVIERAQPGFGLAGSPNANFSSLLDRAIDDGLDGNGKSKTGPEVMS